MNSTDIDGSADHVSFDYDVILTSLSDGREHNTLVLQEALVRSSDSVAKLSNLVFDILTMRSGAWNCFSTVVSYSAGILEDNNVSPTKHGLSITGPGHHCFGTTE